MILDMTCDQLQDNSKLTYSPPRDEEVILQECF